MPDSTISDSTPTIAVIPPVPLPDFEHRRRADHYSTVLGDSVSSISVDVRQLPGGPELTDREYEIFWATVFIVLEAERAAREGAAAIVLDCTTDPGLIEIAQSVPIPVFGPLWIAINEAKRVAVGSRFGVVALDEHWKRMITDRIRYYDAIDALSGVAVVGTHVYQPARGESMDLAAEARFTERLIEAGRAVVADGAQAVILGSTTVIGKEEPLARELGVPVIAPGDLALRTAARILTAHASGRRSAGETVLLPPAAEHRRVYPYGREVETRLNIGTVRTTIDTKE